MSELNKFLLLKGMKKGCGSMFAKDLKNVIQKFGEIDHFEVKSGKKGNQLFSC